MGRSLWPLFRMARSPGATPAISGYTCKPLTGTAYHAVSTTPDIFVCDLATGNQKQSGKPLTGNSAAEGEACLDLAEIAGYDKIPSGRPTILNHSPPLSHNAVRATSRTKPACSSTTATADMQRS